MVDFNIKLKHKKTKEEMANELEKHWASNLGVAIGWNVEEHSYLLYHILEENESMNNFFRAVTWPETYTLKCTYLKKRLPDQKGEAQADTIGGCLYSNLLLYQHRANQS